MSLIEHLEKLRHFNRVTSYKSINEAAQALGVSQAGLSKSIANLESVLGATLFVRTREGLILTKEGELLKVATKKILNEASAVEANLRSLRATDIPDKIRVGMYDSIAIYFFSHLSSYLSVIYPRVEMELLVHGSQNLSEELKRGDLDLAIGVNLHKKGNPKSEFFLLFEDHFSLYTSTSMSEDLSRAAVIFHPDSKGDDDILCEDHLGKMMRNRLIHRVHNFETLKTLTASGLGIGVLPTRVAQPMVQNSTLKSVRVPKISPLFGKHQIGFLASESFLKRHREFAEDIYRLGQRWANL